MQKSYQSSQWLERAHTLFPGGVNSPVRNFSHVNLPPLIIDKAKGPYLWDVDNKQVVDYIGGWGAMIAGHANQAIQDTVRQACGNGFVYGTTSKHEVLLAEKIQSLMPSLEKMRFVSSGTESCMSAIRLARGYTGKTKILKFEGCYHGHVDALLVKAGSGVQTFGLADSKGISDKTIADTLVAQYNHLAQVKKLFEQFGHDIACVIIEPIAANMNFVRPTPDFLQSLRALCNQYNSLLIFDEVITGFRVNLHGAQHLFQIQPDLTCLGKIIGGGFPIGAFGGKQAIMEHLAPVGDVYQAGTLAGHPIAMQAGLKTLEIISCKERFETITQNTQFLCQKLQAIAKQHGVPMQIDYEGGLFGLAFNSSPLKNLQDVSNSDKKTFQRFFKDMLTQGILLAPSMYECGFMSMAHNDTVIHQTLEAFDHALRNRHEKSRIDSCAATTQDL